MRMILLVLAGLFLAAPALAACPVIRYPAANVCFSDGDTAETKHAAVAEIECMYIEEPVTDEEMLSVWRAPVDVTLFRIWCEVRDGTSVALDFLVDDGSQEQVVGGAGIVCDADGEAKSYFALTGDIEAVAGDRLDLILSTVTGDVSSLSVCWYYTRD